MLGSTEVTVSARLSAAPRLLQKTDGRPPVSSAARINPPITMNRGAMPSANRLPAATGTAALTLTSCSVVGEVGSESCMGSTTLTAGTASFDERFHALTPPTTRIPASSKIWRMVCPIALARPEPREQHCPGA